MPVGSFWYYILIMFFFIKDWLCNISDFILFLFSTFKA